MEICTPSKNGRDDSGNCSPDNSGLFDFDFTGSDDLLSLNVPEINFSDDLCNFLYDSVIDSPIISDVMNSHSCAISPLVSPDDGYSSSVACSVKTPLSNSSDLMLQTNVVSDASSHTDHIISSPNSQQCTKILPPPPKVVHNPPNRIPENVLVVDSSIFSNSNDSLNCAFVPVFPSSDITTTSANIQTTNLPLQSNNIPQRQAARNNIQKQYTIEELRKIRNRESARASKDKQKELLQNLQCELQEKDAVIEKMSKQIEQKDSLISLLQKQNSDIMLSLAQLQVEYNKLLAKGGSSIEEGNTVSGQRAIFPTHHSSPGQQQKRSVENSTPTIISKKPRYMTTIVPSRRTCLLTVSVLLLFNLGPFSSVDQMQPTSVGNKGVSSRRILQLENENNINGQGYIYDPRVEQRLSSKIDRIKYDDVISGDGPVTNFTSQPSHGCPNQLHYSNESNSHRIVKDFTEAIEHHRKFNDKNSESVHVDPSAKLRDMLLKSQNAALMKTIFEMLSSWERKDDTVYMFAFGSNEWYLPKLNETGHDSSTNASKPIFRPKMSLVMPALNNSVDINHSSYHDTEFYYPDMGDYGLGFYLMQIDCLIMDTHLVPYNNSQKKSKQDSANLSATQSESNAKPNKATHFKSNARVPSRNYFAQDARSSKLGV